MEQLYIIMEQPYIYNGTAIYIIMEQTYIYIYIYIYNNGTSIDTIMEQS